MCLIRWAMFFSSPLDAARINTRTSAPHSTIFSVKCEPTNPSAPVINTVRFLNSAAKFFMAMVLNVKRGDDDIETSTRREKTRKVYARSLFARGLVGRFLHR